jgi:hypothetical protein
MTPHQGIAYDAVPASLKPGVIKPGDSQYERVKSTYFRAGAPGIVFQTKNTEQVVAALGFARSHSHLPLSIRSGGHGISGRSTNSGGIVIDLSPMTRIEMSICFFQQFDGLSPLGSGPRGPGARAHRLRFRKANPDRVGASLSAIHCRLLQVPARSCGQSESAAKLISLH